jgi:hypothetical protein
MVQSPPLHRLSHLEELRFAIAMEGCIGLDLYPIFAHHGRPKNPRGLLLG